MALICSIGSAPWGSAGHFGKYNDAAPGLSENFDHSDALWQLVYPLVAFLKFKGDLPFDWRGDEACKRLWSELPVNKVIANKGAKAKLGRWYVPADSSLEGHAGEHRLSGDSCALHRYT